MTKLWVILFSLQQQLLPSHPLHALALSTVSSLPSKADTPNKPVAITTTPRHKCTESLVQQLQQGPSHIHNDLSVVSFSKDECGIQYKQQEEAEQQQQQHPPNNATQQQQQLAYIDRQEFVTPTCGKETRVGQALEAYLQRHPELHTTSHTVEEGLEEGLPSVYVAIFLCDYRRQQQQQQQQSDEKRFHSSSKYVPYLKTLPSLDNLQHLPVFWSDASLQELHGSALYDAVRQRRRMWDEEYELVSTALQQPHTNIEEEIGANGYYYCDDDDVDDDEWVDLETWYWARAIIKSRAFKDTTNNRPGIEEEEDDWLCLVPYIDMMNHCGGGASPEVAHDYTRQQQQQQRHVVRCHWSLNSTGFSLTKPSSPPPPQFVRQSQPNDDHDRHPKDAGASVEISYGSHSNAVMLMNYGFAILDDQHQTLLDNAMVSFSTPKVTTKATTNGAAITAMDNTKTYEPWQGDGFSDDNNKELNHIQLSIGNPGPMLTLLSLCRVAACQCDDNPDELLRQMHSNFKERGETTTQNTKDGLIPAMAGTLSRVPFSVQNEMIAMEYVKATLEEQLLRYKTSLAEDEVLLLADQEHGEDYVLLEHGDNQKGTGMLSRARTWWLSLSKRFLGKIGRRVSSTGTTASEVANTRNAIILRRGEKRVLQHFYNLANICLDFLSDPTADLGEYTECLEHSLESEEPLLMPSLL